MLTGSVRTLNKGRAATSEKIKLVESRTTAACGSAAQKIKLLP